MGPARLGDGYRIRVTVARCCSRRRLRTVLVNLRSLEHVRAARLINLVMLLQRQEVVTAAYLARELDVTPRTIARDMVELADAGIRVEPVRGRTCVCAWGAWPARRSRRCSCRECPRR